MEGQLLVSPVQSVVPVSSLQPYCKTTAKKYWHIICRAQFLIPLGLSVLRISLLLISYNNRIFLNIVFEEIFMLPAHNEDIEYPMHLSLDEHEYAQRAIPLGDGVFELPKCARCLLGYSCHSHCPQAV